MSQKKSTMPHVWSAVKKFCNCDCSSDSACDVQAPKITVNQTDNSALLGKNTAQKTQSNGKSRCAASIKPDKSLDPVKSDSGCEHRITGFTGDHRSGNGDVFHSSANIQAESFPVSSPMPNKHSGKEITAHFAVKLLACETSSKIIEKICRISCSKLDADSCTYRIECILKVSSQQKAIDNFEEYREMVKARASKHPENISRCLADGNELLRFYGSTICCSLGINGTSDICTSENCEACQILQNGFSAQSDFKRGPGLLTTSTSGRALQSIEISGDRSRYARKALFLCRVIAGRIQKPTNDQTKSSDHCEFDSVAGEVCPHDKIEELFVSNPGAILPCFVVIYTNEL